MASARWKYTMYVLNSFFSHKSKDASFFAVSFKATIQWCFFAAVLEKKIQEVWEKNVETKIEPIPLIGNTHHLLEEQKTFLEHPNKHSAILEHKNSVGR